MTCTRNQYCMRLTRTLAIAIVAFAGGCTDTADMFPMNEQAQAMGTPHVEFRRGLPHGPVTVTMPTGEVLTGSFQVAIGGGTVTAFGAGGSATAVGVSAGGNFFAAASGPKTSLVCRGNVSFGHGGGECRTQNGALYQIQL